MRRLGGLTIVAVLHVSVPSVWPAAVAQGAEVEEGPPSIGKQPGRSKRLKYRRGPVCMCANGLSEQEIEAAERRRRQERLREKGDAGVDQDRHE